MKIAFVNDPVYAYASDNPSAVGGAERQQWLLARALAVAGWSVTVGVCERLGTGERRKISGVEFVGIGRGTHLRYLWSLYRFLSSERPDWLYWRAASHLLGPVVQTAKVAGVSTIFAAAFDTDVHPRQALVLRQRWWWLYAWGLSRAERLFLQHEQQLRDLHLKWRSRACLVPSIAGVAGPVKPHSQRTEYVAWVGMLRRPKRPDLLVEIARKTPTTRFVVCGGPTDHRSPSGYGAQIVEELAKLPNVDYRGRVRPEEASRVIADAAVLLCTSDQEGFPNTFLQAWSCGTPVVTLTIDPDSIIDKTGLGTVSGTVESAAKDIQRLIASTKERDDIARRAQGYIAEHHSESAVIKAFHLAVGGVFR